MSYTNVLLDMVKDRLDIHSDYKLAQKLNVTRSCVSKWRCGKSSMDWEIAFQIADMLHLDDQNVVYGLLREKHINPRLIKALQGQDVTIQ
nr:transcriptional regulator [Photobacterium halotolerans]